MPVLKLDGARLSYVDAGSGEPSVLFVHGVGGNSVQWAKQVEHFQQYRRVVAIDLPGCGRSEPSPVAHSVDASAHLVRRVIERLGLRFPVIVGHSYGGYVAMRYHGSESSKATALVIVDSFVGYGSSPFTRSLSRRLARARVRQLALAVLLRLMPPSILGRSTWRPLLESKCLANGEFVGYLSATVAHIRKVFPGRRVELDWRDSVPILLVSRAVDRDRDDLVRRFAETIPDVQVQNLGAVGHNIMLEAPTEFNRLLTAFLDSLTVSTSALPLAPATG